MPKVLFGFVVGLVSLPALLFSTVSFSEAVADVDRETLLIVDIDDTLICYPSDLGSTPWFEEAYLLAPSLDAFHEMAGLLAKQMPVAPCESETPAIIRALQHSGVVVVGITGREKTHLAVDDWVGKTIDQLASVGIDLSLTAPEAYRGGIVFGGREKAAAAGEIAQKIGAKRVVIVDDRLSDLEAMVAMVPTAEGRHYQRMARRPYSRERALAQLEALFIETGVSGAQWHTLARD